MSEPTDSSQGPETPAASDPRLDDRGLFRGRIPLHGRTLRQHTARGTIINGVFTLALSVLGFLRMFLVAAFLAPSDYGIWGVLMATLVTIGGLREMGIGDKYVQQNEADDRAAFEKAFTLNLLVDSVFLVLLAGAVPLAASLLDRPEIVAPGLVLVSVLPAAVLLTPMWIFTRRMEFFKQRALMSVDPVISFVITVALAVAGAGYWSLVIGTVAGIWAAALASFLATPYRLRWRFDRRALREYFSFSWPLFILNVNRLILVQLAVFVGELELGIAAVGALTLANSIAQLSNRADLIVTATIYPAVCAVQDRLDLLFETFVKSNRLGLMWAMPFGVGLSLFASDLVHFVLGSQWEIAIPLLQAFGLLVAIGHLGYNWDAFIRARGNTRPLAVVGIMQTVLYLAVALPLLVAEGLIGYAIGSSVGLAVGLIARTYYLTKLFDGFQMLKHALRALAPSVPATAVVLIPRLFENGPRGSTTVVAELVLYAGVTAAATAYFERDLLREIIGYLRRAQPPQPVPAA